MIIKREDDSVTNPTLPTAGVVELLALVEVSQTCMETMEETARSPWNEGYAYGAAEAYGVVAEQIRKLIKANPSGAA